MSLERQTPDMQVLDMIPAEHFHHLVSPFSAADPAMSATSPGVTLGGTNLAGGYSPETFLQMSKKIAQMTQVNI